MCIENTEPVNNSNTDAFLQSLLEGGTFGRKLLCERPKRIHHTKCSVDIIERLIKMTLDRKRSPKSMITILDISVIVAGLIALGAHACIGAAQLLSHCCN